VRRFPLIGVAACRAADCTANDVRRTDRVKGLNRFVIQGSEPDNPAYQQFHGNCGPDGGLNTATSLSYASVLCYPRSPQAPPSRRQEALPSMKRSMPNILVTGFATRSAIEELATIGGLEQKCVAQP
jgi:hypothetical protein